MAELSTRNLEPSRCQGTDFPISSPLRTASAGDAAGLQVSSRNLAHPPPVHETWNTRPDCNSLNLVEPAPVASSRNLEHRHRRRCCRCAANAVLGPQMGDWNRSVIFRRHALPLRGAGRVLRRNPVPAGPRCSIMPRFCVSTETRSRAARRELLMGATVKRVLEPY